MLLDFAKLQLELCESEDEKIHDAAAMATIQISATAIEAVILDMWHRIVEPPLKGPDGSPVGEYVLPTSLVELLVTWMPLSSRTTRIEDRLSALYRHVFRSSMPKGQEPFQLWQDLMKLRNSIVHYRPFAAVADNRSQTFEAEVSVPRSLVNRFPFLSPKSGSNEEPPPWPSSALVPEIASWACETAEAMFVRLEEDEEIWAQNGYCDPSFYK